MENGTEPEIQMNGIPEEEKKPQTNKAYKFIMGFVITVALLIFIISSIVLAVKIVPDTFNIIAGTFQAISEDVEENDTDNAEENTPSSPLFAINDSFVSPGESVTLSWKAQRQDGVYSILFLCDDEDGARIEHLEDFYSCSDTIFFDQGETEAELHIISTTKRYVNVPIILEFENENGIETIDELKLTISNQHPDSGVVLGDDTDIIINIDSQSEDDTDATSESKKQVVVIPTRDLSVRMLQAGPVINGTIVSNTSFDPNTVAAIRFEVQNTGNTPTGSWSFQAILPVSDTNSRVFNSKIQNSLTPGSGVIYTLTFSGLQNGTNQAIITIDPQNLIAESFEGNNRTSATFSVSGGSRTITRDDEADFDIDLIAIGRMSGSRFIETDNLDVDDELAIRFRVTNIGGEETEDWRFEIDVDEPHNADDLDFRSRKYTGLLPGEHRDVTISFDELDEDGDYDFDIEIDPDEDTDEDRRGNNRLRFDVEIDD